MPVFHDMRRKLITYLALLMICRFSSAEISGLDAINFRSYVYEAGYWCLELPAHRVEIQPRWEPSGFTRKEVREEGKPAFKAMDSTGYSAVYQIVSPTFSILEFSKLKNDDRDGILPFESKYLVFTHDGTPVAISIRYGKDTPIQTVQDLRNLVFKIEEEPSFGSFDWTIPQKEKSDI